MKIVSRHGILRDAAAITTATILMISAGCAYQNSPTNSPTPVKTETSEDPGLEPSVILGPGDVPDIKFFSAPQLNETQTIRPDGMITLQLIHDVEAAGKTPIEVREELKRLYAEKITDTELAVIVRSLPGRVVYVTGEVVQPGVVQMPGRLSALEAIMQAHGFSIFADKGKVVVIRHREGKRLWFPIDFRGVLEGKRTMPPFQLEPRDIVYVPR